MNRTNAIIIAVAIVVTIGVSALLIIGGGSEEPSGSEGEIVSRNGVHLHPRLTIVVNGQPQPIPANVGLSGQHNPVHTHDAGGELHYELSGLVRQSDLMLGKFFESWKKPFSSEAVLDHRNGQGGTVKMTVNGQPNAEFENYVVKDGDKIEVRFE